MICKWKNCSKEAIYLGFCDNHRSLDGYYSHREYDIQRNSEYQKRNLNIIRQKRRENISFKEYQKNYKSLKRKNDVNFRIMENMRNRLRYAIKFSKKLSKTSEYLGCSVEQLKNYLKIKFLPGMNFNNYGRGTGKWSIDHIIPCESFTIYDTDSIQEKENKIKKCFHYSNLQPLWFGDNVRKSDKF